MSALLTQLVVGPDDHGVVVEALAQARALAGQVALVRVPARPAAAALLAALPPDLPPAVPVHLHVTDRLLGRDAEAAADVVTALARARPLVVTLHDLPQPSDGPDHHPRRARAYARVADAALAVVVASEHERRLLAACGTTATAHVVPLPVPALGGAPGPVRALVDVAVLGFLYPGKGHEQVLDALPAGVGLRAFGRASDGHEDLLDDLAARAARRGRRFTATGWVADADLPGLLRSPVVPVAPHQHLSASGSVNAWRGAGRRPLVPRSDYAAELLARDPDCVRVYDDLPAALAAALADPASTWLDAPGGPDVAETAARLRDVVLAATRGAAA